jgi:GNAT superfamily N-acetyltransferase
LSTDRERKEYKEQCGISRIEVRDKIAEEYIASIAYDPSKCSIEYLSVDPGYKNQGIGSDLAKRAIVDMRVRHDCREISLWAVRDAEGFWEKLGAKPRERGQFTHVFWDPSSELS